MPAGREAVAQAPAEGCGKFRRHLTAELPLRLPNPRPDQQQTTTPQRTPTNLFLYFIAA